MRKREIWINFECFCKPLRQFCRTPVLVRRLVLKIYFRALPAYRGYLVIFFNRTNHSWDIAAIGFLWVCRLRTLKYYRTGAGWGRTMIAITSASNAMPGSFFALFGRTCSSKLQNTGIIMQGSPSSDRCPQSRSQRMDSIQRFAAR